MFAWLGFPRRLANEWKTFSSEANVLVYQMGKVGSTSLQKSVPDSIQLHTLFENWTYPPHVMQVRRGIFRLLFGRVADMTRRCAIQQRDTVRIITMVRDPYARNLSMYFQHLPLWLYYYQYQSENIDDQPDSFSLLFDAFENSFDHDYPLTWFDREIKKLSGINVYDVPFNKEMGYTVIENGKYKILVLQLEKMNECSHVISNFIGRDVEIVNANISKNKWYASIYEQFKKEYRPDSQYLDDLYSSKFSKHFYTQDQLKEFKTKALKLK